MATSRSPRLRPGPATRGVAPVHLMRPFRMVLRGYRGTQFPAELAPSERRTNRRIACEPGSQKNLFLRIGKMKSQFS